MKAVVVICFFVVTINLSRTEFFGEPYLKTVDGNLYIYGADGKNVSFMVSPKGYLNVNGENLFKVVKEAKQVATSGSNLKYKALNKLEDDLKYVSLSLDQMNQRLNICESLINNLPSGSSSSYLPFVYQFKINKLERRVKTIMKNLGKRECQKDPCMNGATCHDKYLDYECRCLEGWEGKTCEKDVNECGRFAGSDLGCQNGATCINKPGSYECVCATGWYGLHCTRRSNDCSSGPASELCGHGICITQTSGTKGYACVCDQGWKTDGVNPACNVDVDECVTSPCSRNPSVSCHNTPGSFFCGPCPPGYTGSGFSCTDINECLVQNGGCAIQPLVQCINTVGSSACGPCPPGYVGDGKTCTFLGKCQVNNGGCHPNARCQEVGSNIQCQCLPGYIGSGIGVFGCEISSGGPNRSPCTPNPCQHSGKCYVVSETNFTCSCRPGYTGSTCNVPKNLCSSNPCQNGGTCVSRREYFFCRCPSSFSGKYCQKEKQNCGGYLNSDEGELQFPPLNSSSTRYSHNLNCAWIIIVNSTLVINVTFDYFDLESALECQFDWVQIHDGKSAGDHIIGKFCGNNPPNNGTIVSTTNYMYMWFKSDGSKSKTGFKLRWNAVNPVCGGSVNASIHGTIRSPGSPGKYPPNRDCLWLVTAPYGKRITFTFFEVFIETHENCSYDFLEFHEGLTLESPVLARYCNTTIPEPLVTPGNTALVYFHSDQYQSDRGFQISYHPTPGYPGCGGIYTNRNGEISPPMVGDSYIKNMDCAWLIRLPSKLKIKIEFRSFKLEDGLQCNTDFLEIREGSDISSPLIGRYCGYTIPPVIYSESNVLFVRFFSDNSIESTGFRLVYSSVCSETFTDNSGVIKSPGYPEKYRSQEICEFIIQQPPGKSIQIEFQDFEFESVSLCFYDYLEIRDGHDSNSPLIHKYCGTDRPPKIISAHNYLYMKMVTDKDTEHRGFYANYTTVDVSCGGILTAKEGEISSPSVSGSYPPNHVCRWVVVGKPGEVIQLTFTNFILEFHAKCEFDYVAVYDNSSLAKDDGLMGKYCGTATPPLLTTTENIMTVTFHSDTSLSMEGFTASYKILNVSEICGGNYFTRMGLIKSPNYPKPYPNAKTCTWVIRAPYGNKITLNITEFFLEGHDPVYENQCRFDYLEIRDGGYESSPLIGRYCGSKIPKRIVSQSNAMYLKFKSDNTFPSMGFLLLWDGTLKGCGGVLSAVSGSIISPNYPEPYGMNSLCNYKISVSMGSRILLNFMDLDLENSAPCSLDYVEILDGEGQSAKSLGKFCSNTDHPGSLTSTTNQMSIKFVSDVRASGKGFYLKYRTECKTNVTGHRGIIESPNFPEKFPPGSSCFWLIKAPMGNKINISFSDFNFLGSCFENYIEISEGNPLPTNTIGKFCKDNKPSVIASSLDWVHIKFTSGQGTLQGSFRLEWVVNGCGGTFIKPQGSFTSPNYPKLYPPNTLCEYYINVDPSYSIQLYIKDINFESLKNCMGDYLEVFSGPDSNSPSIAKLCQKASDPVLIQSTGNQMYIKFVSDHITAGTGFYANYSTSPAKCGGHQISNTGGIASRNYPKNYNAFDNCLWLIQVEPRHRVNLTFDDFDLSADHSCSNTYVEVFDGPTEDFPSILKHCGNTIPTPNPLTSTSNYLTVRMRTDQGFPAKGFKASYQMVCGAIIVADEPGVITPSYYLHTKSSSFNCTWTIVSPEPDGHITLSVAFMDYNNFDSSCEYGALYVYDGSDRNASLIGTYCDMKHHLPLVSHGNALHLLFHRYPQGGYDQYFWATYSSASSACGGRLYSETGSFATPNYQSGSYPPNSECIWWLEASPGNRIQVNFKEFDIGQSEHCNEEYVELREKNSAGKLLGVYCGQSPPTNLTSYNAIWVKFRSSKLGTGKKGFLADYNLVYGNDVRGTEGKIANPFYPKPFLRYVENINWRVTVDFGSLIRIVFKEVHLDDFYYSLCLSSIRIFDGYDDTAPELLKVCGLVKPDPVTSSSNIVYIVFTHFPVHHGSLFFFEWKKVPRTIKWFKVSPSSSSSCGETIDLQSVQNSSITIANPGWPEPITKSLVDCEWIITSPDYQHLSLTINVLAIPQHPKCKYSYLAVHTRTYDTDWREINRFCLSNETDRHVITTNFMKINFNSGFHERSTFMVTVQRECGNSIKKPNGVIQFNWLNYTTKSWMEDSFCQWDITVTPGKKIRVAFTEFNIIPAYDGICRNKYVLLRNGGSDDSPMLGKGTYCSFPGVIPLTTSNRLFIKAKTSYQSTKFTLRFEEVSPECGKRMMLNDAVNFTVISSPNYPNIPPSKIECVWIFSTSAGHRLQIDFIERFDLTVSEECDEEYVQVRDGGTELSEELGKFCSEKPSTQKSSGNMLLVKYYTNATNPKNGFKAQISLARCGGVIRSSSGILTSPGYSNSYMYDTECRWEIETDPALKLQVMFEDLHLPIKNERVARSLSVSPGKPSFRNTLSNSFTRIWEDELKNDTNCSSSASIFIKEPAPPGLETSIIRRLMDRFLMINGMTGYTDRTRKDILLKYICSNDPVTPIRSSANKMIIVFQSGTILSNSQYPSPRGFKLNFTSVGRGCSYRMDTPSGVISSPGYPNQDSNFYFCTWKITVPKGRRVTLKVEDFDLANIAVMQRVLIYNEHRYRSRIAILTGLSKIEPVYKSSSNLMMVTYWSNSLSGPGHRGFKFTYDSDEAQVCGGVLRGNQGVIASPANLSSFYCKWEFQGRKAENETIAFYIRDAVIGNRTGTCSLKYGAVLAISARGGPTYFHAEFCGNVSSQIVRNPFPYTFVTAIQSAYFGIVNFTITYKVFACGGTVTGPEATIISPYYPSTYPVDVDCAWLISFPPGQSIKLTFQDLGLQPSCSDFVTLKNGPSHKSPLIGQYCGTSLPNIAPITSEGSSLFLEFHSDSKDQGKGFKVFVEPGNYVCGGAVHSLGYEFMTPNFPAEYENNQECEWEITSAEGTHIGLVFVDRFHIESSENCKNDFVEVFDYVKEEWKSLKVLCGRDLPSPINSTSNKMKIIFRSNSAVVSDGFKAKWYQNCGGTLWNVQSGVIISPGYPSYTGNLDCTYIIDHGSDNTFLNFSYFNLEQPFNGRCQFDSLAIYEAKWESHYELVGKFCGSKAPTSRLLKGKIKLKFVTDAYNNFGGFVLNYKTSKCGGFINESSDIGYTMTSEETALTSYAISECTWDIEAPKDKIIAVRMEKVMMPFSEHCSYTYIQLSEEKTNETVVLGRICGHLKPKQLVIKSTGNNMKIKFEKSNMEGDGFSASVVFTYDTAIGCGGTVSLDVNPETVQSPDVNGDGFYEEYLDCTWVIRAKPFHQVVADFRSLDVHSCLVLNGTNSTADCPCDFVELLDGANFHSERLLHTCGTINPPFVTSSGSVMTLKFSTDGTFHGRGFNIQFSSKLSQCGNELLTPKDTVQSLISPSYPDNYPEGLRCKWVIFDPSHDENSVIHVHLVEWDIVDSDNCKDDFLYIEDTGSSYSVYQDSNFDVSRNKTPGSVEIIRGKPTVLFLYDRSWPLGRTKFCGKGKSIDFYSSTGEVTVGFNSNSGNTKKGFKLDYSLAGCTRNYTGEQGHIKNNKFKNNTHCYITITAPTPNHTISLYFSSFSLRGDADTYKGDCSLSYLEIKDGPNVKSPLIGKFCGYTNPSPVFSNGQYLWLHFHTVVQTSDYQNVDLTYTTTDKGKGCGGRLIGLTGTITSPGYPSNRRKNSVCRWDITVPPDMEIVFQFSILDIGPPNTCTSDFIEFYDVGETGTETLRSRFCGGDTPADVISRAKGIVIKYSTSLHNGGTGWELEYRTVTPGVKIL